jgi:hypothetical protein
MGGALCMQLNRNDACTCRDECSSYRSSSRTDIKDEVTWDNASVCD